MRNEMASAAFMRVSPDSDVSSGASPLADITSTRASGSVADQDWGAFITNMNRFVVQGGPSSLAGSPYRMALLASELALFSTWPTRTLSVSVQPAAQYWATQGGLADLNASVSLTRLAGLLGTLDRPRLAVSEALTELAGRAVRERQTGQAEPVDEWAERLARQVGDLSD
jgi:hypothetical protein